jgi:hypothetical protein
MIKTIIRLFAAMCALVSGTAAPAQDYVSPSHIADFTGRPRVIVISDIAKPDR